jgi:serine/threonine protein kinase
LQKAWNLLVVTGYELIFFLFLKVSSDYYIICDIHLLYIFGSQIIHRDLAARNVLISGNDDNKICKVADFGLSRSIRDKESDMYEQRTAGEMPIRWMAPESLSMGLFSTKSDVWAFGILVFEIVTLGSTPYIGLSAQEVIKFIRDGHIIEQPEHCNNDFYSLMKSCWAYDCEERLTFTELRMNLSKMIEFQSGYVDLQHFNENLYYNLNSSPGEKV